MNRTDSQVLGNPPGTRPCRSRKRKRALIIDMMDSSLFGLRPGKPGAPGLVGTHVTLGAGFIVCRWTIWRLGREAGATPAGAKQKPTTAVTGAAAPPPQNPRRSHELTDYAHRQPCLMMRNHHQSTQSGCCRLFAALRGRNFFGRQKRKNGQNPRSKDQKKYNNKGYPWEAILSEKKTIH